MKAVETSQSFTLHTLSFIYSRLLDRVTLTTTIYNQQLRANKPLAFVLSLSVVNLQPDVYSDNFVAMSSRKRSNTEKWFSTTEIYYDLLMI